MNTSDRLLTIKEAADYLKVHWQTVRSYIKNGDLKAHKIGRAIRIRERDLEHFLSNTSPEKQVYEIEIRYITQNRKIIEQNLLTKGAHVIYQGHIIDHWFVPNKIKDKDHKNKWYESGKGYGVRVREQDNGYTGKITTTFEVKRLLEPYKHHTCIEHEMDISRFSDAERILHLMNYKRFVILDKDRLIYKYKDCKVVIDDIKNFKTGIEIESVTDISNKIVIPQLIEVAKEIGLLQKEQVKKSVTNMYMDTFAQY